MKIFRHLLFLSLFLTCGASFAQSLEDLKAPSMPAAAIIGTQVNEISKPKTLKKFEAVLLNNFVDSNNNLLIPNNFAFEINPFMLSKRKNFDYKSYLDNRFETNIWRHLSFSLASTNNYVINDTVSTNALGFAARTILSNGKVDPKLAIKYDSIVERHKRLFNLNTSMRNYVNKYVKAIYSNRALRLLKAKLVKDFGEGDSLFNTALNEIPKGLNPLSVESDINSIFQKYLTSKKANSIADSVKVYFDKNVLSPSFTNLKKTVLEWLTTDKTGVEVELAKEVLNALPNVDDNLFASNSRASSAIINDNIDNLVKTKALTKTDTEFRNLIQQVKVKRYGLRIDLNTAMGLSFTNNDFAGFGFRNVPRYGAWMNLSYKGLKKDTSIRKSEFIFFGRYLGNNQNFLSRFNSTDSLNFKAGNAFDFGFRYVKEIQDFSLEVEYIYRLNQNKKSIIISGEEFSRTINDDTYKLLVNLNYKISPTVVFSYSIGKNFNQPNLTKSDLINGFTVNFGFGALNGEDLVELAKREAISGAQ
ncbi:MAG: hypothetical protein JKY48_07230 [Flavobacteriales bacterium]|nr:hypothetical protein [Flavobacteriales bacterium]